MIIYDTTGGEVTLYWTDGQPADQPRAQAYSAVMSVPRYSRLNWTVNADTTYQAPLTVTATTQTFDLVYSSEAGGQSATIGCAIEHGGTVYQAKTNGQARATVSGTGAGQWATFTVTLPAPIQSGTTVRVRTFAAAGSVLMRGASAQNGPVQEVAGDLTTPGSGAITVNPGVIRSRVTPVAVLGYVDKPFSVAGLGDSIMEGGSDKDYEAGGGGFFTRATLETGVPASCFGVWADNFPQDPVGDRRYGGLLGHHTHAVCEYGTNALSGAGNTGWKPIAQSAVKFWEWVAGQGVKLAQTTLIPKTDSTDSWATVEGQTVTAPEQVRLDFNAWVRAGAPLVGGSPVDPGTANAVTAGATGHPLVDVIDTDAAVATTKADGSHVWDVDPGGVALVIDGTHPTAAGHARMAQPVTDWILQQKAVV